MGLAGLEPLSLESYQDVVKDLANVTLPMPRAGEAELDQLDREVEELVETPLDAFAFATFCTREGYEVFLNEMGSGGLEDWREAMKMAARAP